MKGLVTLGVGVGALVVTGLSVPPVASTVSGAWSEPQAAKTVAVAPKTDDLDGLLAPIALYPDALLAQMLLCAAKPAKVAALNEWMAANPTLKGSDLQDAATKSGFDQSFAAMVLFPDVVESMASQIEWTTRLGEAFAADRSSVFASIQRLRKKASQAGKLKTTARRIGRNELGAIRACRTYVIAQQLYARRGYDDKAAGLYATALRITSRSCRRGTQTVLPWSRDRRLTTRRAS